MRVPGRAHQSVGRHALHLTERLRDQVRRAADELALVDATGVIAIDVAEDLLHLLLPCLGLRLSGLLEGPDQRHLVRVRVRVRGRGRGRFSGQDQGEGEGEGEGLG